MKTIEEKKECLKNLLDKKINELNQKNNELDCIKAENYNKFLEDLISSLSYSNTELIREIQLCQNNDNLDITYPDKVRKRN